MLQTSTSAQGGNGAPFILKLRIALVLELLFVSSYFLIESREDT